MKNDNFSKKKQFSSYLSPIIEEISHDESLSKSSITILLIEDNRMDAELLLDIFRDEHNINFEWVKTLSEGLSTLQNINIDMVLLDLNLPDSKGINTFDQFQLKAPDTPVIILTGDDNHQNALDAVRKGAQDYLVKQAWDASYLLPRAIRLSIERALIRKQLLSANKALKSKNKELDRFVHMASHDLINPLNSIIGFASVLNNELDESSHKIDKSLFSNCKEYTQHILNTSIIMNDLIQDLLALTYAEHGKLEIENVSLNICFNTATQLLISEINETGAQIESDQLPEVKGDSHLLSQLFLNLIGNAIKYVDNKIPVIMLTSSNQDIDKIEAYDSGVNSYVVKPFSFDEFVTVCKSIREYWEMINKEAPINNN